MENDIFIHFVIYFFYFLTCHFVMMKKKTNKKGRKRKQNCDIWMINDLKNGINLWNQKNLFSKNHFKKFIWFFIRLVDKKTTSSQTTRLRRIQNMYMKKKQEKISPFQTVNLMELFLYQLGMWEFCSLLDSILGLNVA